MKEQKHFFSLLVVVLSIVLLSGCAPSEDKAYDALEDFESVENATLDMRVGVLYWGSDIEMRIKAEIDGDITHTVVTGNGFGEEYNEEYYTDGEFAYYLENGSWEKHSYDKSESEISLTSWDIDSISKSKGVITAKGTVKIPASSIDSDLGADIGDVEMDFRAKMDKKYNIESINLKADNISSEITSISMKIDDIDDTVVDLSKIN